MPTNPILEEVWRIKEALVARAGGDVDMLCEQTRQWASTFPHTSPVARTPAELRSILATKTPSVESVQEEQADYRPGKPE